MGMNICSELAAIRFFPEALTHKTSPIFIDVFPPGPWTSNGSAPIWVDKSRNESSLELFWGSILVFLRNPVGKRENDLIAIPD